MTVITPPASILAYWNQILGQSPWHGQLEESLHSDYPIDSECGQECKKIIDLTKELLDACDPASHDMIRRGAQIAVEVTCFG